MRDEKRADGRLVWGGLLIVLGAALLLQTAGIIPGGASVWFGAGILGAIGLGFVAIYLTDRARWWAVIPAGVLLSLATVTGIDEVLPGPLGPALFLLGLAATFGAVAVVPGPCPPRTWALIPAGVLAAIAAITLGSGLAAAVFWPLVLMLVGVFLVVAWAGGGHQGGSQR